MSVLYEHTEEVSELDGCYGVYCRKREMLEFLIQREMKVEGCKTPIPFKVVSRVYYNREVLNHKIEKLAKQIVKNIIDKILFGYIDNIGKVGGKS